MGAKAFGEGFWWTGHAALHGKACACRREEGEFTGRGMRILQGGEKCGKKKKSHVDCLGDGQKD